MRRGPARGAVNRSQRPGAPGGCRGVRHTPVSTVDRGVTTVTESLLAGRPRPTAHRRSVTTPAHSPVCAPLLHDTGLLGMPGPEQGVRPAERRTGVRTGKSLTPQGIQGYRACIAPACWAQQVRRTCWWPTTHDRERAWMDAQHHAHRSRVAVSQRSPRHAPTPHAHRGTPRPPWLVASDTPPTHVALRSAPVSPGITTGVVPQACPRRVAGRYHTGPCACNSAHWCCAQCIPAYGEPMRRTPISVRRLRHATPATCTARCRAHRPRAGVTPVTL